MDTSQQNMSMASTLGPMSSALPRIVDFQITSAELHKDGYQVSRKQFIFHFPFGHFSLV